MEIMVVKKNKRNFIFALSILVVFIFFIIFYRYLLPQPIVTPPPPISLELPHLTEAPTPPLTLEFTQPTEPPPPLSLEVFTTTMTQIILQWKDSFPNTKSYELQRDLDPKFPNPTTYTFEKGSTAFKFKLFSDTNREPGTKHQFLGHPDGPLLERGTVYHYRIKAKFRGRRKKISNVVSAQVSGPIRGIEGDLWADIVIGQQDFLRVLYGETTDHSTLLPGGILIDRNTAPNRVYIADTNNSRILGFSNPTLVMTPMFHIGQPDFTSSEPNGNGSFQNYPYETSPSASTLALRSPDLKSIVESGTSIQMALDSDHNLYVPDVHNNRILKYDDPFANDSIADDVWGQPDFESRKINRSGDPYAPVANGFGLTQTYKCCACTIDKDGNLWVVDTNNNRVLRFSYDPDSGAPAKTADLVLGQPDFTSRGGPPPVPPPTPQPPSNGDYLARPRGVKVNSQGWVYVSSRASSTSGILEGVYVYKPPFTNGMEADHYYGTGIVNPAQIVLEGDDYLWIMMNINPLRIHRLNLSTGEIDTSPGHQSEPRGLDLDSEGNLFVCHRWAATVCKDAPSFPVPGTEVFANNEIIKSASAIGWPGGAAVLEDQLIVADQSRLLIWNNYDIDAITSGQAADDLYGDDDFGTQTLDAGYALPQTDSQNRLWLYKTHRKLIAFDPPLRNYSTPVKEISLENLNVLGGGTISAHQMGSSIDFVVDASREKIWVADRGHSRVFRISNINGGSPIVDIILGQENIIDVECNRGDTYNPTAQSMCYPYNVQLDGEGNLYVSDNGGGGVTIGWGNMLAITVVRLAQIDGF